MGVRLCRNCIILCARLSTKLRTNDDVSEFRRITADTKKVPGLLKVIHSTAYAKDRIYIRFCGQSKCWLGEDAIASLTSPRGAVPEPVLSIDFKRA